MPNRSLEKTSTNYQATTEIKSMNNYDLEKASVYKETHLIGGWIGEIRVYLGRKCGGATTAAC